MLENRRISPRYVIEDVEYLKFPLFTKLAIPMNCFCDIKLHTIIEHTAFYGEFGIGFKKSWLIEKGLQPIHYLNERSSYTQDLTSELQSLLNNPENIPEENQDYIFKKLFYIKPIQGSMWDKKKQKYVNKIFHDENEWRYVPIYLEESGFKPFIRVGGRENIEVDEYRNTLNTAMFEKEQLSLKFSFEDIRYLFVKDDEERIKLINFILYQLKIEERQKAQLISKIQSIEDIKEDY
ncbi:hypothetical protein HRE96_13530 [Enterococcus faecalis]|nr:hypothetical protein [Enterococcus faecalis]